MSGFKNPFALKDGSIITISDALLDSNSSSCDYLCPSCSEKLKLRTGETNSCHFSHSDVLICSRLRSYMSGLNYFIKDFLENEPFFVIPKLECFYVLKPNCKFDENSFGKEIFFTSQNESYKYSKERSILISNPIKISFDKIEIEYLHGFPEKVIAYYHNKKLAFVAVPPVDIISKTFKMTGYKDCSTIGVNFPTSDFFSTATKPQILAYLNDNPDAFFWLSNNNETCKTEALQKINADNNYYQSKVKQRNFSRHFQSNAKYKQYK